MSRDSNGSQDSRHATRIHVCPTLVTATAAAAAEAATAAREDASAGERTLAGSCLLYNLGQVHSRVIAGVLQGPYTCCAGGSVTCCRLDIRNGLLLQHEGVRLRLPVAGV